MNVHSCIIVVAALVLAACGSEEDTGGGENVSATPLTVNGASDTQSITADSRALYVFTSLELAGATAHTITATISTGNVDLDFCSFSTCTWGDGLLSSGNAGTTTEIIDVNTTIAWDYYVNVQGIADSTYTISVTAAPF